MFSRLGDTQGVRCWGRGNWKTCDNPFFLTGFFFPSSIIKFAILSNALTDIRYLTIFLFLYLLCLLGTLRSGQDELRWHLYSGEAFPERADHSKAFTRQLLDFKTIVEWMTFISGSLVAGEYIYNNSGALTMFSLAYGGEGRDDEN